MSECPMVMRPELLKFCAYYKGEEKKPSHKNFESFAMYWYLERNYYSGPYEDTHEYWETEGQDILPKDPHYKKILSKIHSKTIRGFLAWSWAVVDWPPSGFFENYKFNDVDDSIEDFKSTKLGLNINNKSETREEYCLYYKGEDECPFDMRSIQSNFWLVEKIWDVIVRDDEIERSNKEGEFLYDFPDAIDSIKNVPVSLKATLYNQYCRFGGDKYGFEDHLNVYLSSAPKA